MITFSAFVFLQIILFHLQYFTYACIKLSYILQFFDSYIYIKKTHSSISKNPGNFTLNLKESCIRSGFFSRNWMDRISVSY